MEIKVRIILSGIIGCPILINKMVKQILLKYTEGDNFVMLDLPESFLGSTYKGVWDATTNIPTLIDGTGTAGDYYIVSVGGTQDLGSGSITYEAGNFVLYNGSIWQKESTNRLKGGSGNT